MFPLILWNGLKIWILNFSSKFELTKNFEKWCLDIQMWKNFQFKPCVYVAYFRGYGHLKIVKRIAMY